MANELLRFALDESRFQLEKVLEGLSDDAWTAKPTPSFSPAQTVEHLCEVYTAYKKHVQGEPHEWGSYNSGETTREGVTALMWRLRGEACEAALAGNEEAGRSAIDYIVMHDAYHVGQLVTVRLALDPEWNAYSIYRSA
ncbi:MAG TPA: DinB family protein [Fimbriimonadaceae bacterium]|nr:DinB family protein [Fimbriimonadaceae bacterium]HRJ95144.1 DinB family protein [Fimbriimonadaceae bacterium]